MTSEIVQSHLAYDNGVLGPYTVFWQRASGGQDIWKPGLGMALSLSSLGWGNSRNRREGVDGLHVRFE